jgi:transcriptional antiterminator RfaH
MRSWVERSNMLRWYLIQTKPSGEMVAQTNLARQGYEVYLPRLRQPVRRAGRWRDRIVALFPRYLFLRLREGTQSLAPVRSSIGVADIVRFGFRYAVVSDRIVDDLKARSDPDSGLHQMAPQPFLKPGMRVRITTGAFDGLEGIFERDAGSDRVDVLLRLLGQEASARVPAAFVVAACDG